jgi:hypothetical protein
VCCTPRAARARLPPPALTPLAPFLRARSDIAVPSMGESMSEGTIAVVLKQPGAFHAAARRTLRATLPLSAHDPRCAQAMP